MEYWKHYLYTNVSEMQLICSQNLCEVSVRLADAYQFLINFFKVSCSAILPSIYINAEVKIQLFSQNLKNSAAQSKKGQTNVNR